MLAALLTRLPSAIINYKHFYKLVASHWSVTQLHLNSVIGNLLSYVNIEKEGQTTFILKIESGLPFFFFTIVILEYTTKELE